MGQWVMREVVGKETYLYNRERKAGLRYWILSCGHKRSVRGCSSSPKRLPCLKCSALADSRNREWTPTGGSELSANPASMLDGGRVCVGRLALATVRIDGDLVEQDGE